MNEVNSPRDFYRKHKTTDNAVNGRVRVYSNFDIHEVTVYDPNTTSIEDYAQQGLNNYTSHVKSKDEIPSDFDIYMVYRDWIIHGDSERIGYEIETADGKIGFIISDADKLMHRDIPSPVSEVWGTEKLK